jgi:hypothetical protein
MRLHALVQWQQQTRWKSRGIRLPRHGHCQQQQHGADSWEKFCLWGSNILLLLFFLVLLFFHNSIFNCGILGNIFIAIGILNQCRLVIFTTHVPYINDVAREGHVLACDDNVADEADKAVVEAAAAATISRINDTSLARSNSPTCIKIFVTNSSLAMQDKTGSRILESLFVRMYSSNKIWTNSCSRLDGCGDRGE